MLKTFSEDLKYFRESKNMTLKDVALDTRLNMAVLENMENGDFTFQPQTYIRAFLRQYAKSIGLSPDGILKDYEQAKMGNYSTKRLPPEEKLEAFEDIKKEEVIEPPKIEVKKTKPEDKKEEVFDKFNIDEFKRSDDKKEVKIEEDKPKEISKEVKEEKKDEIKKEEKKTEQKTEEKKEVKKSSDGFNFPPPREKKPIEIQRETEDKKNSTTDPDKRFIVKTKNVNSSALKTIFIVVIFLLIGAGVYSLINIFLTGNDKGPEIQRKSFDEVVKENEKKILGKKTPEEIQDSINKAEEEKQKLLASKNDSLVLEIGAYKNTWVILDVDSTTIDDPKRTYLTKGYTEVYKAKKFFHIGTPNVDLIEVKLNGEILKFDRKNFRNLYIDKNGISEE